MQQATTHCPNILLLYYNSIFFHQSLRFSSISNLYIHINVEYFLIIYLFSQIICQKTNTP